MSKVSRYVVDCNRLWKNGKLLTAADERADHNARVSEIAVEDVLLLQKRVDVLEGLLKSGSSPTYAHCAAVMEALKPAEVVKCEHSYHHFGDYPRRRCNLCNKLEPAEGGGDE